MKTIYLSEIVDDTYTNSSGYALFIVLKDHLSNGRSVSLSFKGATPTSTSFLNSSLGELLDHMGFADFKTRFKLIELSKSQSGVLRKYFDSCDIHA